MRQHLAIRVGLSASDETASVGALMLRILRHILLVLVALALVGGPVAEAARAAHRPTMLMNGVPCDMEMPVSNMDHSKPAMPCKGMTHDCINMAGCVTATALPAEFAAQQFPAYQRVRAIWPDLFDRASLYHQPDPLPPRTA